MAIESQLQYNASYSGGSISQTARGGQKMTVSDISISKLGFWLSSNGTPPGTRKFQVRQYSDKSLLGEKEDTTTLTATPTYIEVTFDSPVPCTGDIIICVEWTDAANPNQTIISRQNADVKADEYAIYYTDAGGWSDVPAGNQDMAYVFYYENAAVPVVVLESLDPIGTTTATANCFIHTAYGASITQHGVCWNTTGDPTTGDSKTQEGAGALGVYSTDMTSLTNETLYYARAYVTTLFGTAYSNQVEFITGVSGSVRVGKPGSVAIKSTMTQYFDASGKLRYVEGNLV